MSYVDGFVIPVKKQNLKAYRKMATLGAKVWMKHGALQYLEATGDDLFPKGFFSTFAKLTKMKEDETIIFAFILFESRAHRNRVNKLVMKDPAMDPSQFKTMPFDMKRMAYGGFKTLVAGKR